MLRLRALLAVLVLPGTVTVIVPGLLLVGQPSRGAGWGLWGLSFPLNLVPIALGVFLMAIGIALMAKTIALFLRVGKGTLAPWDAPRRLVVEGVYRHVRNPMISGVFCVLFGEAAILGSSGILVWALAFIAVNVTYVPLVEEPALRRRFGEDYEEYVAHVPRWAPRRNPWLGGAA